MMKQPASASKTKQKAPSERARVRRLPARARYDRATVYSILDEGLVAHVAFCSSQGPIVVPLAYARIGDRLCLHGSSMSRTLTELAHGIDVCVAVTLIDGLVLARSAFHHSMNYRSVIVFGRAYEITDLREKRDALDRLVEHLVPGRTSDARAADEKELSVTAVLRLDLREVSAKTRTGAPKDVERDYKSPVWAGVVPIAAHYGTPIPDARLRTGIAAPHYVKHYSRPRYRSDRFA